MTAVLRVEMLLLALLFIAIVFYTVNTKRLQMRYSLIWLLLSFALVLAAVFPQLVIGATALAGIETPSNFIYLLGIFFLLILCFSLTVNLSRQADRAKRMVQWISIRQFLEEEEKKKAGRISPEQKDAKE